MQLRPIVRTRSPGVGKVRNRPLVSGTLVQGAEGRV